MTDTKDYFNSELLKILSRKFSNEGLEQLKLQIQKMEVQFVKRHGGGIKKHRDLMRKYLEQLNSLNVSNPEDFFLFVFKILAGGPEDCSKESPATQSEKNAIITINQLKKFIKIAKETIHLGKSHDPSPHKRSSSHHLIDSETQKLIQAAIFKSEERLDRVYKTVPGPKPKHLFQNSLVSILEAFEARIGKTKEKIICLRLNSKGHEAKGFFEDSGKSSRVHCGNRKYLISALKLAANGYYLAGLHPADCSESSLRKQKQTAYKLVANKGYCFASKSKDVLGRLIVKKKNSA